VAEENRANQATVKGLGKPFYDQYETLVQSPEVDAILICTETAHHWRVAVAAFEAGKDVIVEKPIATTEEEAQAMIAAAKANGRILAQCYPCRYHPTARAIKGLIDAGEVGWIAGISATNHGRMPDATGVHQWFSDPRLAGGGAVMDHTTHVSDLISWFTGQEVREVFARTYNHYHPDRTADDAGQLLLTYGDGMIASIDPSWNRPANFATWGDVTMTVYGEHRTIMLDMFNQYVDVQSNRTTHPDWVNYGTNMDELMLRDFVVHMSRGETPPLTGIDGLRALRVALAAYKSAQTGLPSHVHPV
jgi:predicted dehydrogenase